MLGGQSLFTNWLQADQSEHMKTGHSLFKLIDKVTVIDGYGVPIHEVTAILVSIRIASQQEYAKLYQNLCFYRLINWQSSN